jgi:hypothetical protein
VATRATVVTKDAQNLFIERYVLTCRFVARKALEVNTQFQASSKQGTSAHEFKNVRANATLSARVIFNDKNFFDLHARAQVPCLPTVSGEARGWRYRSSYLSLRDRYCF